MKKIRKSIKLAPILIMAIVMAIIPLAGIGCNSSSGSDGPFNFIMQAPYGETDPTGITEAKFKELVESLTDGKITVEVNYNGALMDHTAQFEGLQSKALDLAVQNPGYSRNVNLNFDFSGGLAGLIVTKEHFMAMEANDTYMNFQANLYKDYGIKFLGYTEGYLMAGGYFSTFPMTSLYDFKGHTIYNGRSGNAEPYEALLGAEHVYFEKTELSAAIMGGQVGIIAMPSSLAYSSGMWAMPALKYYIIRPFYNPYTILMNLSDWNDMSSELQDIVTQQVMPQLQGYMTADVVQNTKDSLKSLVGKLGVANVHVVPTSEEDKLYSQLLEYPAFQDREAGMNQDMLSLIKGLRPDKVTWDSDITSILAYAGLS